jgi:hypothetical protein
MSLAADQSLSGHDDELTDAAVLSFIGRHCGTAAVATFPLRYEPTGAHPGDKVFYLPLQAREPGQFIVIGFMFGSPSADEMRNYKARWHSLSGPMSRAELEELALPARWTTGTRRPA